MFDLTDIAVFIGMVFLRVGVPGLIIVGAGYLLKRLDRRWEAEAHEYQAKMAAEQPAVSRKRLQPSACPPGRRPGKQPVTPQPLPFIPPPSPRQGTTPGPVCSGWRCRRKRWHEGVGKALLGRARLQREQDGRPAPPRPTRTSLAGRLVSTPKATSRKSALAVTSSSAIHRCNATEGGDSIMIRFVDMSTRDWLGLVAGCRILALVLALSGTASAAPASSTQPPAPRAPLRSRTARPSARPAMRSKTRPGRPAPMRRPAPPASRATGNTRKAIRPARR